MRKTLTQQLIPCVDILDNSTCDISDRLARIMDDGNHVLYLNPNHIKFEPVQDIQNGSTSVFYDEGNEQIFVVKNKGLDGVNVKGPDTLSDMTFHIDNIADSLVYSLKFNATCSILGIQKSLTTVIFVNFTNGQPGAEYGFTLKTKNARMLGFCWTSINEVVFVTDLSIEFCQLTPARRQVKSLRAHPMSIFWYVYHPRTCFLLVSMGSSSNVLQTLQFASGTMYKLAKFEVDMGSKIKSHGNQERSSSSRHKKTLYERDVCLTTL
jgi:hypothetical protein